MTGHDQVSVVRVDEPVAVGLNQLCPVPGHLGLTRIGHTAGLQNGPCDGPEVFTRRDHMDSTRGWRDGSLLDTGIWCRFR